MNRINAFLVYQKSNMYKMQQRRIQVEHVQQNPTQISLCNVNCFCELSYHIIPLMKAYISNIAIVRNVVMN